MKTVVFQSYRTSNVPGWIAACMQTVKAWAQGKGYDYRFYDDSFLELAPQWYRDKCAGEICPVTDLARLVMARDLLRAGYDSTVWVDADALVFAPEALVVDSVKGFAFAFELWAYLDEERKLQCRRTVNNSVSVFTRDNQQLDFLIDVCLRIAGANDRVHKLAIGAHFVTALARIMPMPVLPTVGIFSPVIMDDIASGALQYVPDYAAQLPARIGAANLCNSLVGTAVEGVVAPAEAYERVVDACLRTRGDLVNRHVKAAA